MSFVAFASGVFQGLNEIEDAKIDARLKEQDRKAKQIEDIGGLIQTFVQADKLDPSNAAMLSRQNTLGKIDQASVYSLLNQVNDAENNTPFGSVLMPLKIDFDDSNHQTNLSNLNMILSNPEDAEKYFEKFRNDKAGGQQLYRFIEQEMIKRGQKVYLKDSIKDEETGIIKQPAVSTFSEYKPLLQFHSRLGEELNIAEQMSPEATAVKIAINQIRTDGNVEADELLVITNINKTEGASGKFVKLDEGQGAIMDEIAKNYGFANRHVLAAKAGSLGISPTGDAAEEYMDLLQHTVPLQQAGALNLSNITGPFPGETAEVSELMYNVSPTDNTAEMVNALVPLMKLPEKIEERFGLEGQNLTGPQMVKAMGNKIADVSSKYGFAQQAGQNITEILTNMRENNLRTGLAGILQRANLAMFGEGGQADQMFGGFDPATQFEKGTTAESLAKVVSDSLGIDQSEAIGQNQAIMIALAYSMARAEDSNGRLSDADLKIQLDLLQGSDFFDNKVTTLAKLERLQTKFTRMATDLEPYAKASKKAQPLTDTEVRQLMSIGIVEGVRKFRRQKQAGDMVSAGAGMLTMTMDAIVQATGNPSDLEDGKIAVEKSYAPIDGQPVYTDNQFRLFTQIPDSNKLIEIKANDKRLKFVGGGEQQEQSNNQPTPNPAAPDEFAGDETQGTAPVVTELDFVGKTKTRNADGSITVDGVTYDIGSVVNGKQTYTKR